MDSQPFPRLRIAGAALIAGVLLGGVTSTTLQVFADGSAATDAVPRRIPYQGYLEFDGAPVQAIGADAIPMRFTLYDGPEAEEAVYAQALDVEVFAGRFTSILGPQGDGDVAIADVVAAADDLYLGITLLNDPESDEDDVELANRQQILATPYAMWSTSSTNLAVGNDASIANNLTVGANVAVGNDVTVGNNLGVSGGATVTGSVRTEAELVPSVGGAGHGVSFPDNPAGGSGDSAWIRYFVESGENTRLQIGVSNDPADRLEFVQNGATRMRIESGNVQVTNALTVGGSLRANGHFYVQTTGATSNNDGVGFEFKRQENCSGQRGRLIVRRVGNDSDDALCACLQVGSRHGNRERWFCMEPD